MRLAALIFTATIIVVARGQTSLEELCIQLDLNAKALRNSCQFSCLNGTTKLSDNNVVPDMEPCGGPNEPPGPGPNQRPGPEPNQPPGPRMCLGGSCVDVQSIQLCTDQMATGDTLNGITDAECSVTCLVNGNQTLNGTKIDRSPCRTSDSSGTASPGECQGGVCQARQGPRPDGRGDNRPPRPDSSEEDRRGGGGGRREGGGGRREGGGGRREGDGGRREGGGGRREGDGGRREGGGGRREGDGGRREGGGGRRGN